MTTLGFEISEDGTTEWRNNGGIIERKALYASHKWETVAETSTTPHTAKELRANCEKGGFGYIARLTYTAVARDCNSWDPNTGEHHITWTCGHNHKSLDAARKCLASMGNAGCSYHARIERSDYPGYGEPTQGQLPDFDD